MLLWLARTMRIGLLLSSRSTAAAIFGHRNNRRGCASSSSSSYEAVIHGMHRRHHRRRHPPPTFVVNDIGRARPSIAARSSSSKSSSSSFVAPEPPKSHGAPVFPDIEFRGVGRGRAIGDDIGDERGGGNDIATSSDDDIDIGSDVANVRNTDEGAIFVVSGSSRGIGLQFVIELLKRTRGTVLACCRNPSSAARLTELRSMHPTRLVVLSLDLEDQRTIDELAYDIATKYKRVDLLLNVAGMLGDGGRTTSGPERSLDRIDRDWLEKSFAVNVIGPTMLSRALSPLMRTRGRDIVGVAVPRRGGDGDDGDGGIANVELPRGRCPTIIVNLSARVGSISDNVSGGWYSYRMSKSALNMMTRTMGHELRRQGTWILSLHPGTTDTDLSMPFRRNVDGGRLFPVDFTVERLLAVIESMDERNTGGFYDWAGKALPF